MARPKKQVVDYFPHYCDHGQTMFIVEQRYGNDGYALWFKILEILGKTKGHYLDCNKPATWEFLQAKTHLDEKTCDEILDLLAKLEAIDPELWKSKVIWSDNFISGIADVYRNRGAEIPPKPSSYQPEPTHGEVSTPDNPQSKVKESKEKKIIDTPPISPPKPEAPPRQPTADTPPAGEDVGGEGKKEKKPRQTKVERQLPPYSQEFEQFYQHYPNKKGGKEEAWAKWERRLKNGKLPPFNYLMECLYRLIRDSEWMREDGRFVPMITTFLNNGRWTDVDAIKGSMPTPQNKPDPDCPYCKGSGFEPKEKDGVKGSGICRCRKVKR